MMWLTAIEEVNTKYFFGHANKSGDAKTANCAGVAIPGNKSAMNPKTIPANKGTQKLNSISSSFCFGIFGFDHKVAINVLNANNPVKIGNKGSLIGAFIVKIPRIPAKIKIALANIIFFISFSDNIINTEANSKIKIRYGEIILKEIGNRINTIGNKHKDKNILINDEIITNFIALNPLPSSTNFCPGNTDIYVESSGTPKNIAGTKEIKVWDPNPAIITKLKKLGSKLVSINIALIVFEWIPGINPEKAPNKNPIIIENNFSIMLITVIMRKLILQ